MEKVDLTYLNQMSDGNNELIVEMAEIYKSQIPEFINNLQEAYKNNDWQQLAAIAHKAKSSVAIIGLNNLANELKTLETDAKEGVNTDNYLKIINNFIETAQASIVELENIISEF